MLMLVKDSTLTIFSSAVENTQATKHGKGQFRWSSWNINNDNVKLLMSRAGYEAL